MRAAGIFLFLLLLCSLAALEGVSGGGSSEEASSSEELTLSPSPVHVATQPKPRHAQISTATRSLISHRQHPKKHSHSFRHGHRHHYKKKHYHSPHHHHHHHNGHWHAPSGWGWYHHKRVPHYVKYWKQNKAPHGWKKRKGWKVVKESPFSPGYLVDLAERFADGVGLLPEYGWHKQKNQGWHKYVTKHKKYHFSGVTLHNGFFTQVL